MWQVKSEKSQTLFQPEKNLKKFLTTFFFRYGHHGIASEIFKKITLTVSSEHYYFWLTGLEQICLGEHFLNDVSNKDLLDR